MNPFACKIIFATQLGPHIESVMRMDVVIGVRKEYRDVRELQKKELVFELDSCVVVDNIDPKTEKYPCNKKGYVGDWLCKDDQGYWRLYSDQEYRQLPADGFVAKPTNRATRRQILAILCAQKLEREFEKMSYDEKVEFARKYPELVNVTVNSGTEDEE